MGYPGYNLEESVGADVLDATVRLKVLSRWIDDYGPNAERPLEAQLWGRTMKGGEEHGEVVAAMILYTCQNPRKPGPSPLNKVVKELLDEATAALGGIQHIIDKHNYPGDDPIAMLFMHIGVMVHRAGLDSTSEMPEGWEPKEQALNVRPIG
jgi:hypothetical protein